MPACIAAAALAAIASCEKQSTEPLSKATPCGASKYCGVTVAPVSATLGLGDTLRFAATSALPLPAGVTFVWASSDTTKVKVDATGLARAVSTSPGVAVCASVSADPASKGCASIVSLAR
jgi:uncharacterized protein YjdB